MYTNVCIVFDSLPMSCSLISCECGVEIDLVSTINPLDALIPSMQIQFLPPRGSPICTPVTLDKNSFHNDIE